MSCSELILAVVKRLTLIRRVNFCLVVLCPLVLGLLVYVSYRGGLLSAWLFYLGLALALAVLGVELRRHLPWALRVSQAVAARLLDHSLSAKDRFLTIATHPEKEHPAIRTVMAQATSLAANYRPKEKILFSLERPAKRAAIFTPLLALLTLIVFVTSPPPTLARQKHSELSRNEADELRELANDETELPDSLREDLLELAELIEDEGLLSEPVFEQLEDLLDNIQALDDISNSEDRAQELASLDQPKEKSSAAENPETPKDPSEPQSDPATDDNPQESAKKSTEQQEQQNKTGEDSSEKKSEQQGKAGESGDSEKSEQAASDKNKQGKSDGPDSSGKQSGEQPGSDQATSPQAPKDPKTGTAGVGDGKSRSGQQDDKEQKGAPQPGADDGNAKDGKAENRAEDGGSPGDAKPQEAKEQGGEPPHGSKPKDQPSSKDQQAKQQGAGDSKDGSGDQKDGSTQGEGTEQAAVEKMQKTLEDLNQRIQEMTKEQSQDSGQQQNKEQTKNQQDPNKQGSEPSAASAPQDGAKNKTPKPAPKQPGEQQATDATQPQGNKTSANPDQSGNFEVQRDLNERAKKLPTPSKQAQRYGPFDGGEDGLLDEKSQQTVRVDVPLEEKIVVRSVGSGDKKLYKNKPGARARTELGSSEFQKPEAELTRQIQPIPVEYRDLLQ